MDVEIGSNLYRNTDGTIEIEGVAQMTVGLKKPEGPLVINFVMFDDVGRVIAKVVDSSMAFNERRAHELERTPTRVTMKQTESGKVVLDVELKDPGRVVIRRGEFLTIRAHLLEITPDEWRVQKLTMRHADHDVKGGPVMIG